MITRSKTVVCWGQGMDMDIRTFKLWAILTQYWELAFKKNWGLISGGSRGVHWLLNISTQKSLEINTLTFDIDNFPCGAQP